MKRLPGEPFEDYRDRRAAENAVSKSVLKGRLDGRYVDEALHKTMQKATRFARFKKWVFEHGHELLLIFLMAGVLCIFGILVFN